MEQVKVLVVDKQIFYRRGLCHALSREAEFELFDSEPSKLMLAIENEMPDLVLLDIDHPSLSGLGHCQLISYHFPTIKTILLTPIVNGGELIDVIKNGAVAYLNKNTTAEELSRVIRQSMKGEYPISDSFIATPKAAEQILKEFQDIMLMRRPIHGEHNHLTARETQILNHIAGGKTNKQIANVLNISEQTVKNHVSNILRKLNADDRAHAVARAMHNGWITGIDELSSWLIPVRVGSMART